MGAAFALVTAVIACGSEVTTSNDASTGGDGAVKDAPSDGDGATKLCGDGTPLGCANGKVECCPPGAPCRAPEPFCDLGGGKCTPGDC